MARQKTLECSKPLSPLPDLPTRGEWTGRLHYQPSCREGPAPQEQFLHGIGPSPRAWRLFTEAELADHGPVAGVTFAPEIIQEAAPLSDQHQQAAAAVVVFLVNLEVFLKVVDALGEESDLNFWRASVAGAPRELLDGCLLTIIEESHVLLTYP